MSTREHPESGLFTGRAEFLREDTTGQVPADPAYRFFSDNVRDFTHTPGLNINRRDGLGTPDAVDHDQGNEEPEMEFIYDLQNAVVDGSDDPDDASGDAWLRNGDGRVPNTHHIRVRESREASDPDDPTNASGCRIYTIGKGGHADVEKELDPADGRPVEVTLTYACEKVRDYDIFQPPGDEALDVVSTDTNDTSQTLTIEDDAGTAEDVDLNGMTPVTTAKADWDSIRALELDAEASGDVTVSMSTSGDTLATIRGAAYYSGGSQDLEGDLGVPAIGSGSLATAIGTAYERFHGASVTRGGSALDYDLNRVGISCDNGYDPMPRTDSTRSRYYEGNRDLTVEADVVGWGASVDYHDQALGLNGEDIVIKLSSTEFTFGTCVPVGPGDKERGADDTAVEYSVEFEPEGSNAISITQP
jgi:hypothetical protein